MHDAMLQKLKQHRKRALIRAWEMRQLEHAKGVWYRLRYQLSMAERIYAIRTDQADMLASEGYAELAVGAELSPRKRLFSVPRSELSAELTAHPLAPRLSAAVLTAPNLLLVPWDWR